jgi:spore coat polysaccharide biosynthesis protein SpsF
MKVVAIVQARMGSTRLPGKVLLDIGGESMLARVVQRVRRAQTVQRVVVAATLNAADEPIVRECRRLRVELYRGSELDVLDRFHQVASLCEAGVVVRITSDCPLIDPGVIDRVVEAFLDWRPDYASNVLHRTYPRGLDTEVVDMPALERAWREAVEPCQRAHVTPYFYEHPGKFRLLSVTCEMDHGDHRWTVDTPEDLAFVREVYARLNGGDSITWEKVLELLVREPALLDLNRQVRQKLLHEG